MDLRDEINLTLLDVEEYTIKTNNKVVADMIQPTPCYQCQRHGKLHKCVDCGTHLHIACVENLTEDTPAKDIRCGDCYNKVLDLNQ